MCLKFMKLKGNFGYFPIAPRRLRGRMNRLDVGFPILLTKLSTALE